MTKIWGVEVIFSCLCQDFSQSYQKENEFSYDAGRGGICAVHKLMQSVDEAGMCKMWRKYFVACLEAISLLSVCLESYKNGQRKSFFSTFRFYNWHIFQSTLSFVVKKIHK